MYQNIVNYFAKLSMEDKEKRKKKQSYEKEIKNTKQINNKRRKKGILYHRKLEKQEK